MIGGKLKGMTIALAISEMPREAPRSREG